MGGNFNQFACEQNKMVCCAVWKTGLIEGSPLKDTGTPDGGSPKLFF